MTILYLLSNCFIQTRPKPAYGRQGLDWIIGPGYSFDHHQNGVPFDPKNVTSLTGGPNGPPFDPKNVTLLTGRVQRDPGTRPVPIFFSSTRPVPTRKLKMTGYWVIKFHFESNETQPRMKRRANKVTNPINPGTGSHFFAIY